MINKYELRLGNIVGYKEAVAWDPTHHVIIRLEETAVRLADYPYRGGWFDREFEELMPIELTPELLEAFGFEHSHHRINPLETEERYTVRIHETDYHTCFVTDTYGGELHNSLRFRIGWDDVMYPAQFKYLHHLQNTIYYFTGTELEVNLPTLHARDIHPLP
jgi:hypothetical protein